MRRLLRLDGRGEPTFTEDRWQVIEDSTTDPADLPAGPVLVPLKCWDAHRDVLRARAARSAGANGSGNGNGSGNDTGIGTGSDTVAGNGTGTGKDDGGNDGDLGVWLDSDQEAEAIADDLPLLAIVALNFPVFSDGRSLSNAVLLRTRFGWRGELRAIGDVQRDQLAYMRRCGFDAFAIRADLDPEAAAAGLRVMSDHYQGDVHEPRPAFLRMDRPAA